MKKIILIMSISTFTISSTAGVYQQTIPQPDFISNDWDGDTIPNSIDPDDDNDGINDELDSDPFGFEGQSTTPPPLSSDFLSGQIVTLSSDNNTVNNIESVSTTITNQPNDVWCLFEGRLRESYMFNSSLEIASISTDTNGVALPGSRQCGNGRWDFSWNAQPVNNLIINLIEPASVSGIAGDNSSEHAPNVPDSIALYYSLDEGLTWVEIDSWPNFYPDVSFSGLQNYSFTASPIADMFKFEFTNNDSGQMYWPEMHLISN